MGLGSRSESQLPSVAFFGCVRVPTGLIAVTSLECWSLFGNWNSGLVIWSADFHLRTWMLHHPAIWSIPLAFMDETLEEVSSKARLRDSQHPYA